MLLTAIGTEAWFRYKERGIRNAPAWSIATMPEGASGEQKPLPDYVENMLKYDEGFERSWTDGSGNNWHLIYLRWAPARMAVHRASPHQPEICQAGIGRKIISKSEIKVADVHGIPIRYHIYEIQSGAEKFHLMFVPNDDRTADQLLDTLNFRGKEGAERWERLERVRQGRRHLGQRSLQLSLVGVSDAATAEQEMLKVLPSLIQRND